MKNLKKFVSDHRTAIIAGSAVVVVGVTIIVAKKQINLANRNTAAEREMFDALFNAFKETDTLAREAGVAVETLDEIILKNGFSVINIATE